VVQRLQKAGRDTSIWALDKHIIPALGDMAISDITLRNLQELCDLKIKAGLSVQSVKHIKARLSAIFKHALGHRIIEGFNPATAIRLPKMTRKERFTPTEKQVGALLAVLQDPSYSPCFEAVAPIARITPRWQRSAGGASTSRISPPWLTVGTCPHMRRPSGRITTAANSARPRPRRETV
jgi:integrase